MKNKCTPVRVMLVGDAAALAPQLKAAGYAPSIAADTADAWDEIQRGGPCLVVLRAENGECEALRLVHRLRGQGGSPQVRVLLLAGDASDESLSRGALDCGADECVFSPFAPAELLARVRRLLDQCAASTAAGNARGRPVATPQGERALLHSLGRGVIGIDLHGRITFENPAARALLGWQPGEMIAQEVHARLHCRGEGGGACSPEACPIHQTLRDGKPRRVHDENFVRNDGTSFPVEYVCTPVREDGGSLTGAVLCFSDTTETMRAAEVHAEQTAMLNNAQRIGHMGSWSYNARTGCLQWSDATCELFGITQAEFRGSVDQFLSFVLPEDLPAVQAAAAATTVADPLLEVQYRIRRPDGSIRWLSVRGSVAYDGSGATLAKVGVVMDVTEQKLTHERLAESLALTKIASRLAQIGAWTIDLPERKLTWSDENCAIHDVPPGYQPTLDEGLGLFAEEDREHVVRLVTACAEQGTPYEFEVPKFTAKGRRIWVRSIGEALRDSTGRIVRLQGAFQDVTDRKLAEYALRQQAALLHIAGRVARIGGWAIDMPQRRIEWSDEVVDMLEFGREVRPRLREFLRLASAKDRRCLWAAIAHCALTGTPFDLEGEVATRRGRRIWVRVIGEAEYDASGALQRVQGALQDISERLALAEQLRQAQRLESLGQLTGGVAHDFNNLLTVILGNAEMLGEELAGDPQLRPLAQVVVQAAQRAADLTQRLLAFARRQALEPKAVDINRLVSGMDTILRHSLGEHIVIDFQGADELWPALVDPMQLDNTLLNLCLNARDAMPQGGRLDIRTSNVQLDDTGASRRRDVNVGQYVMLAVSDTGAGIAPEHMARVFEPFFTTKEKGKGTGLGLAMTYGFVKQSGGHVEIESLPRRGTTVRLYLPRAAQASEQPQQMLPVVDRPALLRTAHRIMLVEDNELVRLYARDQLIALGYAVLEAHDGMHALTLLDRGEPIDLLFTDVVMPGMSGRELADRARTKCPGLRVLYTSGYSQDAIVHDGRLDAGVQLLAKPYRRDELARRISAVLAE